MFFLLFFYIAGTNIGDHFTNLAQKQVEDYVKLAEQLFVDKLPQKPTEWAYCPGWVKYDENDVPVPVNYPEEQILVFDVEVIVQEGNFPALATAMSDQYWYGV